MNEPISGSPEQEGGMGFLIETSEFAQRRSSFELCSWIDLKLAQMRMIGRFDELYFERRDPRSNIKKLVEEAIPLSRLGLYLTTPETEVHLTCFADNRNHDALVELSGFNQRSLKVEVTTTESDSSVLRRQALSRLGHVQLTGAITRIGSEIVSDGEMVPAAEEDERCISLMFGRLRDKVETGKYDKDTAILVFLTEFRAVDAYYRAELLHRTKRYLLETGPNTKEVYYCYSADYSIDSVRVHYR